MKSVVRLPVDPLDKMIPVGVVSNTYHLVQHYEVVEKCLESIHKADIDATTLRCELGLTDFAEWMTLRIFFPDRFSYMPGDAQRLNLCLECFNSVEGSSRLTVLFSWLRLICTNGLAIRETKAELSDVHDRNIDLDKIAGVVCEGLPLVNADLGRLQQWEQRKVRMDQIAVWVNKVVATDWGKKAACRIYHICRAGHDVEYADAFAPGEPSEKPVVMTVEVPGARVPADNLYDVSQALSWVASHHQNLEERLDRQGSIADLITKLGVIG